MNGSALLCGLYHIGNWCISNVNVYISEKSLTIVMREGIALLKFSIQLSRLTEVEIFEPIPPFNKTYSSVLLLSLSEPPTVFEGIPSESRRIEDVKWVKKSAKSFVIALYRVHQLFFTINTGDLLASLRTSVCDTLFGGLLESLNKGIDDLIYDYGFKTEANTILNGGHDKKNDLSGTGFVLIAKNPLNAHTMSKIVKSFVDVGRHADAIRFVGDHIGFYMDIVSNPVSISNESWYGIPFIDVPMLFDKLLTNILNDRDLEVCISDFRMIYDKVKLIQEFWINMFSRGEEYEVAPFQSLLPMIMKTIESISVSVDKQDDDMISSFGILKYSAEVGLNTNMKLNSWLTMLGKKLRCSDMEEFFSSLSVISNLHFDRLHFCHKYLDDVILKEHLQIMNDICSLWREAVDHLFFIMRRRRHTIDTPNGHLYQVYSGDKDEPPIARSKSEYTVVKDSGDQIITAYTFGDLPKLFKNYQNIIERIISIRKGINESSDIEDTHQNSMLACKTILSECEKQFESSASRTLGTDATDETNDYVNILSILSFKQDSSHEDAFSSSSRMDGALEIVDAMHYESTIADSDGHNYIPDSNAPMVSFDEELYNLTPSNSGTDPVADQMGQIEGFGEHTTDYLSNGDSVQDFERALPRMNDRLNENIHFTSRLSGYASSEDKKPFPYSTQPMLNTSSGLAKIRAKPLGMDEEGSDTGGSYSEDEIEDIVAPQLEYLAGIANNSPDFRLGRKRYTIFNDDDENLDNSITKRLKLE